MLKKLADLLNYLEMDGYAHLSELRKKVLNTPIEGAQNLIEELKDKERLCTDLQPHNDLPFICSFMAYAYRLSGNITEGITYATRAVEQFRPRASSSWNKAIAHLLLSGLYSDNENQESSYSELEKADTILKTLGRGTGIEGQYFFEQKYQEVLDQLHHLLEHLPKWKPQDKKPASDNSQDSNSFKKSSKQQLGFLGTSVIVNRPGESDRLICDGLIPNALEQNASIIFPLSTSGGKYEKLVMQTDIKIIPNHIYQIEGGTQNDSAKVIANLRSMLHERSEGEKEFPIVVIFNTLQKWTEELEIQIRYLIQDASFLNLRIWIHSPIFLIPSDLLPTIGNVVIIWPSKNEVRLLAENLPSLEVEFGIEPQAQGLYFYDKASGNEWQFSEFPPPIAPQ